MPPAENGVSDIWSPRKIILGQIVDYDLHCREVFGSYVHGRKDYDIKNDIRPRTFAGIFFGTTGNFQGTVKVWDLNTGCVKKPKKFTSVPMPEHVIDQINKWGQCHQKKEQVDIIESRNRNREKFWWENDDYQPLPLVEDPVPLPDISAEPPGMNLEEVDTSPGTGTYLPPNADTTPEPQEDAVTTGVEADPPANPPPVETIESDDNDDTVGPPPLQQRSQDDESSSDDDDDEEYDNPTEGSSWPPVQADQAPRRSTRQRRPPPHDPVGLQQQDVRYREREHD